MFSSPLAGFPPRWRRRSTKAMSLDELVTLQKMLGADKALSVLKRHWHVRQAASLQRWQQCVRDGEELSRLSALRDDEARRRRDAEQAVAAAEAHAEQCERRAALTLARLDEDKLARASEVERRARRRASEVTAVEESAREEAERLLASESRRRRRAEEGLQEAESARDAEARRRREAEATHAEAAVTPTLSLSRSRSLTPCSTPWPQP